MHLRVILCACGSMRFVFLGFLLVGPQFNMTSCVIFGSAPATCGLPSFVCSCSVFIQETL